MATEFRWSWQRTKEDLDPFQEWQLKSNLEDIRNGVSVAERVASLKAQGYIKLANAVEKACSK